MVYRKLEERTAYVKQHFMMNRSMKCKSQWMDIKRLHQVALKLDENLVHEHYEKSDDHVP